MLTVRRLATMRAALVISMAALVAESGSAQSFKTIYSFQGAPTAKDQMARSSEKTGSSTARPIAGGPANAPTTIPGRSPVERSLNRQTPERAGPITCCNEFEGGKRGSVSGRAASS